jgi:hypothetical protein
MFADCTVLCLHNLHSWRQILEKEYTGERGWEGTVYLDGEWDSLLSLLKCVELRGAKGVSYHHQARLP